MSVASEDTQGVTASGTSQQRDHTLDLVNVVIQKHIDVHIFMKVSFGSVLFLNC